MKNKLPPKILILRLSAIGDVLHATPVARELKKLQPDCHITWLVSPPADKLLTENPHIDEVLVWDSAEGEMLVVVVMEVRLRS